MEGLIWEQRRQPKKAMPNGGGGTTPGLNFIYVEPESDDPVQDLNIIYITGPGHGGPGLESGSTITSLIT